jgi:hypothetical protein
MCKPPREFPARDEGRVRTASSPDPSGSSWRLIKGCLTPVPRVLLSVPLAGPGPSDGAGPSRLCQGCSRPHRHHPVRLPSAPPSCCDRISGEGLSSPLESTAPHGASTPSATPSSPLPSTPASRCATSRKLPRTPTREPRSATTGPGSRWTGTPPTSSPPTSPEPPDRRTPRTHRLAAS